MNRLFKKPRFYFPGIFVVILLVLLILQKTFLNKPTTDGGLFIISFGLIDVILFILAMPVVFLLLPLRVIPESIAFHPLKLLPSSTFGFFFSMYAVEVMLLFIIGYFVEIIRHSSKSSKKSTSKK